MKVIFTVGVSASGKSTYAHQQDDYVAAVVCRDDIRHEIAFEKKLKGYDPNGEITHLWDAWKWNLESEVTDRWWLRFGQYVQDSRLEAIICADTNLNRARLDQMKLKIMADYGFVADDFIIKEFPIEFTEAVKRDNARPDGVGENVIFKQYQQWLEYKGFEKYMPDVTKPKAVIFDVDGTLADHTGVRTPFEWHKVGRDRVRDEVADMLRGYALMEYKIIILSGRDGVCYGETMKWLFDNQIHYTKIFMRKEGDSRKDSIIKEELFREHVAPNYNVKMVVDDRSQVCRLWLTLGVPLAMVGNPYVEF